MRADIPRTERDEVCCSGDDEDDVGLDDQGPGDEEEEDEEEETLEEGEDVEDRSTEPDAGSLDRVCQLPPTNFCITDTSDR
jgi:hypothetical protein